MSFKESVYLYYFVRVCASVCACAGGGAEVGVEAVKKAISLFLFFFVRSTDLK